MCFVQVGEQSAERKRRGGVAAGQALIRLLAVLGENGAVGGFEVKAVATVFHRAGEVFTQEGNERGVGMGALAQNGFGGGKATQLVAQVLKTVSARKRGDMRVSGGHVAEGDAGVDVIEKDAAKEIAAPVIETRAVDHGAGGDNADDVALDKTLGLRGVLRLLADGDLVALGDQTRNVGVRGVIGDPAHGCLILGSLAAVARGQDKVKLARGGLRILVEHLVKVAETEKEDGILILFLDLQILPHHRRKLSHLPSLFLKNYTSNTVPPAI